MDVGAMDPSDYGLSDAYNRDDRGPPFEQSVTANTTSSSGSDSATYTDYGLKRALNRVFDHDNPSMEQDKDSEYIRYDQELRTVIATELNEATEAFDAIDEIRRDNENPAEEDRINRAWNAANHRLAKADLESNIFHAEVADLQAMPPMTRERTAMHRAAMKLAWPPLPEFHMEGVVTEGDAVEDPAQVQTGQLKAQVERLTNACKYHEGKAKRFRAEIERLASKESALLTVCERYNNEKPSKEHEHRTEIQGLESEVSWLRGAIQYYQDHTNELSSTLIRLSREKAEVSENYRTKLWRDNALGQQNKRLGEHLAYLSQQNASLMNQMWEQSLYREEAPPPGPDPFQQQPGARVSLAAPSSQMQMGYRSMGGDCRFCDRDHPQIHYDVPIAHMPPPQDGSPEAYGAADYGAETYAAEDYGAEAYGAEDDGSEVYGSEAYGTYGETYGAENYGAENYGAESYGAQEESAVHHNLQGAHDQQFGPTEAAKTQKSRDLLIGVEEIHDPEIKERIMRAYVPVIGREHGIVVAVVPDNAQEARAPLIGREHETVKPATPQDKQESIDENEDAGTDGRAGKDEVGGKDAVAGKDEVTGNDEITGKDADTESVRSESDDGTITPRASHAEKVDKRDCNWHPKGCQVLPQDLQKALGQYCTANPHGLEKARSVVSLRAKASKFSLATLRSKASKLSLVSRAEA
ncbi:hypothetical protein LTR85_007684 [Meristemomyces frigidus]|nr:hypothetical protein LTR85_007684 [Meristemomyces frigidus]